MPSEANIRRVKQKPWKDHISSSMRCLLKLENDWACLPACFIGFRCDFLPQICLHLLSCNYEAMITTFYLRRSSVKIRENEKLEINQNLQWRETGEQGAGVELPLPLGDSGGDSGGVITLDSHRESQSHNSYSAPDITGTSHSRSSSKSKTNFFEINSIRYLVSWSIFKPQWAPKLLLMWSFHGFCIATGSRLH